MKIKSSVIIFCLITNLLWCFVMSTQISQVDKITTTKTCLKPKFPRLCRSKLLRYAYNPKSNSCVSFYYSGCGAANNHFITYEECRRERIPQSRY